MAILQLICLLGFWTMVGTLIYIIYTIDKKD